MPLWPWIFIRTEASTSFHHLTHTRTPRPKSIKWQICMENSWGSCKSVDTFSQFNEKGRPKTEGELDVEKTYLQKLFSSWKQGISRISEAWGSLRITIATTPLWTHPCPKKIMQTCPKKITQIVKKHKKTCSSHECMVNHFSCVQLFGSHGL